MHVLELYQVPILEQLRIEEALMRLDDRQWLILNHGVTPAVVMGISGCTSELNLPRLQQCQIPIIRRFSGGGTVIVDSDTLFVSLIGNRETLPFPCFPERLMRWTTSLYQEALQLPYFGLQGNDYAIGQHKCGGNAQYIQKKRWLHHTTFLWDYKPLHMDCLHMPKRTPAYRKGRSHEEFLCRLCDYLPSPADFFALIRGQLEQHFPIIDGSLDTVRPLLEKPHRRATCCLDYSHNERQ